MANNDAQESNNTTATTNAAPRQEEPMDQYDYYTKAARSFSGTERVKPGSRPAFGGVGGSGGSGGKLRTIAFVPASTNPMLKTDHPAFESDQGEVDKKSEDDGTSSLTERVEKLRLPRRLSLPTKSSIQQAAEGARVVEDLPPGSFEHITFPNKGDGNPPPSRFDGTEDESDAGVGGDESDEGVTGAGAGAAGDRSGYSYLLQQRKLVEGIQLTPLPQHLITTYRPGYHLSHSQNEDNQASKSNSTAISVDNTDQGANQPQIQELTKDEGQGKVNKSEDEEERRINLDPTTKYLTFLPHSGFHNQRTELENALLLARLLNRTLIMPKVYLGPPMPWLSFNLLHSRLLYQTKIGLEHCRAIIESQVEYEDEDDGEVGGVKSGGGDVDGMKQQKQGYQHDQYSQELQPPKPADEVVQEKPLPLPVQEQKEVMPEPAGYVYEPEIKDDTQAGGKTVLSDESAATLDGQQVVRPTISADKEAEVGGESEVEAAEEEVEEEDKGFQSWIEEPDEEDQDRVRIATGDGDLGSIMDLEDDQEGQDEEEEDEGTEGFDQIKDWSQTAANNDGEDDEDFEMEQRRQRQRQSNGYDYEMDPTSLQLGILDDDDEDDETPDDQDYDFDWRPEYYSLRQQRRRYRDSRKQRRQGQLLRGSGGRLLSQQTDVEGAALPLYLPALERPIDRKAAGLRLKKRSFMPTMSPPLDATAAAGSADAAPIEPEAAAIVNGGQAEASMKEEVTDSSQHEKRQLAGQYAFQQQQQHQQHQPMPPEQHQPMPPEQRHRSLSSPYAVPIARKKKKPSRPIPWSPLPAECLEYESWTMTDWDLFFDLNPLRHYVRILTRESMSMAYLESQFNITFLHPEEPIAQVVAETMTPVPQVGGLSSAGPKSDAEDDGESDEDESDKEGDVDEAGQEAEDEGDTAEDTESDTGDDSEKPKRPLLRSEADVLFFDDSNLYDYRFSENPNATESQKTRSKFAQEFTIDWLAQRPEKLIHLGSIFGTGRVAIESLEAKAWLQMIRDHLIIQTEVLQTTSQSIANKISGRIEGDAGGSGGRVGEFGDPMEAGFVGIHIRMSDGHFSLTARDTIENIRQELMWQIGMSDPTTTSESADHASDGSSSTPPRLSIEQCRARALNHHRALQHQLLKQQEDRERERELGHPPMKPPPSNQQQQQREQQSFMQIPTTDSDSTAQPKRRSNGRYTPIYLATDAHRPRSNPIFDDLFSTFDCIFTLDDFSEDLESLTQYRNPEDGTLMARFLIPMVDAMVVAKAAAFFGTPASTFSNYIQRQLRPAYTGLYD
ncbi:hypothetical protein BGZ97_003194 [Linnemannia gamsii]|uniref:Uncharacterized protein n=1 Tax=Linnemannia gamsii TaxID=64522 RepID=A0A9P6QVI5_9FUNG|nr:hypothetical protein BGZ97_003194 [Linnemannia gamsii]